MKIEYQLSISDACKKHGRNRSTLTSWVENGKVVSEKRMIGRKAIHFINEESLLEQMERSTAATTKPKEAPDQPPITESKSERKPHPEVKPGPDKNDSRKSDSDTAKKSHPRKRPRSNQAVSRAKRAMRSLDQDELIRVNGWLAGRILDKSKPPW